MFLNKKALGVVILGLIVISALIVYVLVVDQSPNNKNTPIEVDPISVTEKLCGGIAAIECPLGYRCDYPEPIYPDAMGTCVKGFNF